MLKKIIVTSKQCAELCWSDVNGFIHRTCFCFTLSVSWVDVAAVCTPHHQCHSVRGGVCQTHCWLHGPVPEWSDYTAKSRSVPSLKILTSQIFNAVWYSSKVNWTWKLANFSSFLFFFCLQPSIFTLFTLRWCDWINGTPLVWTWWWK